MAIFNLKSYGADGDGGECAPVMEAIVAALLEAGGGTLFVPDGVYDVGTSTGYVLPDNTRVLGSRNAVLKNPNTGNNGIFTINAGAVGISIEGLTFRGPYYGTTVVYSSLSTAIRINGTGASPCQRIRIIDCEFDGWGDKAVYASGLRHRKIAENTVINCGFAGIFCESAVDARITRNQVRTIGPGVGGSAPNLICHGIFVGRDQALNTASNPASERVLVAENSINSVVTWHGITMSGVKSSAVTDNILSGTYLGISVEHGDTSTVPGDCPSQDVNVTDNNVNLSSNVYVSAGIALTSSATGLGNGGVVSDNVVTGHGGDTDGAILILNWNGVALNGNMLHGVRRVGIDFQGTIRAASINGGIIQDITTGNGANVGIMLEGADQQVACDGVSFYRTSGSFIAFNLAAPNATFGLTLGASCQFIGTITKFVSGHSNRVVSGGYLFGNKAIGYVTVAAAAASLPFSKGVASVTYVGTGHYTIVLSDAVYTTNGMIPVVTPRFIAAPACRVPVVWVTDAVTFDVYMYDAAGTLIDSSFNFHVTGTTAN